MNRKNILFISPACYPISSAEAIVNYKFVSALRKNGHFVTVISQEKNNYNYPKLNILESEHNFSVSVPNGKNFKNLFLHFVAFLRTGHFLPSVQFFNYANIISRECIKKHKFDLILCSNHPGPLLGLHLTKKFNIPLGIIWNDPFPESKYPKPYSKGYDTKLPSNWKNYLNEIQQYVSYNFFANDRLRKYMFKYLLKLKEKPYATLGHIIEDSNEFSKDKKKCFKLIHSGNLKMPRDPSQFIHGFFDFINEMKLGKDEIKLDLIGIVDNSTDSLIKELNLTEYINVSPPIDYFKICETLNNYDMGIIIEAELEEGIFLPSKLADYIQAGLPIISYSPQNGVINDIFTSYGGGEICNNRTNTHQKLNFVYELWKKNKLIDKYLKSSLTRKFSPDVIVEKFSKTLAER